MLLIGLVVLLGAAAGAGELAGVALRVAGSARVPVNPLTVLFDLAAGKLRWSAGATVALVGEVVLLAGLVVTAGWVWKRLRGHPTRVDDVAPHLGRLTDVESLTEAACRAKAVELQVRLGPSDPPGVPIGRHLLSGASLRGSFEDLHCYICGPRTGKSSAAIIPAILDAPGAVISTSNKRDVVDATRDPRSTGDRPVWVFDPQAVANESPTWWWNPLSWVTDEVRAADLAEHFANGDGDTPGVPVRKDPFFDPEGQDLLAALFLAAAKAELPITRVWKWVTNPNSRDPVQILENHGFTTISEGLLAQYMAPDRQRAGVFGTAKKMARALRISAIHPWITNDSKYGDRPHFDPREFIDSGGTLYSLSLEGNGSAGPLVTALTVAAVEAAREKATRSPGGRLPIPLLAALDEIANVVRWAQLPNLYSHLGSRGIVVMAMLQSYSQGMEVWGREGMDKLWSASNVAVFGGGVRLGSDGFLRNLSESIGDHGEIRATVSVGERRSVSRQLADRRTLPPKLLQEWPRGRALVLSSGNRATIVATVPWWQGPHAEAVRASLRKHSPKPQDSKPAAANLGRGVA